MKQDELLAWIDIETTGLDVRTDHLLEVAIIVTDQNMMELARHEWVLYFGGRIDDSHEVVQEMHKSNGLWQDSFMSLTSEVTWRREFNQFLEDVLAENPDYKRFVMAGSGVARFDYKWFEHNFPEIIDYFFNYYTLDIGVVRRALELSGWFPEDHDDEKPVSTESLKHRAMSDIEDHILEWTTYREMMRMSWHVLKEQDISG